MASSTGHGGTRLGSGRKRKPLAEKILEGNKDKRAIKKLPDLNDIPSLSAEDMPLPSDWLKSETKNTQRNIAPEIFEVTYRWVKERKCDHLIRKEQIEQYALSIARYVQCEDGINQFGLLAKHPTTNMPIGSPYVAMSITYLKQANMVWAQIFQTVKENCEVPFNNNPNDDIMEQILTGKI